MTRGSITAIAALATCAGITIILSMNVALKPYPVTMPAEAAPIVDAPDVQIKGTCDATYSRVRLDGETKCLRAGQICARRYHRQYATVGYVCDRKLRLRDHG